MLIYDAVLSSMLALCAPKPVREALRLAPEQCTMCGALHSRPICVSFEPEGLIAYLCLECGVYFTKGKREGAAVDAIYEAYWSASDRSAAGTFVDRCASDRADHIDRWFPNGIRGRRVLEVGAGRGELARELIRRGALVEGIEPDARMASILRDQLAIPVFAGMLEDYEPSSGGFDIVTLSHVLEHLPHPIAALLRIRSWLAPSGGLAVEVPNADVLAHGRLQNFFFDEWTHLFHFDRMALTRAAAAAGFKLSGIEEVLTNHWGKRTALRAMGTLATAVPLPRNRDGEASRAFRRALTEQVYWRFARRPFRQGRNLAGRALKRMVPGDLVDAIGRRLG